MSKTGVCPVCNGNKRIPAEFEKGVSWSKYVYGYDENLHTVNCDNCGGQTQSTIPTGIVPLREDGTPCKHKYYYEIIGNCLRRYKCIHCTHQYEIDSSD